jgi:hypothetical protein
MFCRPLILGKAKGKSIEMPFLFEVVFILIIVGLLLWVVQQIPMDAAIAKIIRVVVVVAVVLWLLYMFMGAFGSGPYWPAHAR